MTSIEAFCWTSCSSFSTWVKVAVCAIMSRAARPGCDGSWYRIWATSRLRNVSDPIWSDRSTVLLADAVA